VIQFLIQPHPAGISKEGNEISSIVERFLPHRCSDTEKIAPMADFKSILRKGISVTILSKFTLRIRRLAIKKIAHGV
jgi:hypothetical protein